MKTVFSFDPSTGIYLGTVDLNESDRSPLEPDVWHIPGYCTEIAPPVLDEGQFAKWDGTEWQVADVPKPQPLPPVVPLTLAELNERIDANRAAAYRAESDSLFFKWQRGEATKAQWLEAIAAIKERYPKVTQTEGGDQ